MARPKPITVGDRYFPSKTAAKEAMRDLMRRYRFGDRLDEEDKLFCLALFEHHSEHSQKVGRGIEHIEVRPDDQGNKYLHLLRVDGTDEDISWCHCISPKKEATVIYEALRSTVKDQIQEFKDKQVKKGAVCPFRRMPLTLANSHVDHFNPTFEALVAEFFRRHDHALSYSDLAEQEGNDFRGILKDQALLEAWRSFHLENANLRLISAAANLSEARKQLTNKNMQVMPEDGAPDEYR